MRITRRGWLRGSALVVMLPLGGGVAPLLAAAPGPRPGPAGVAEVYGMGYWSNDAGTSATPIRAVLPRRIEVPQWHAEFL